MNPRRRAVLGGFAGAAIAGFAAASDPERPRTLGYLTSWQNGPRYLAAAMAKVGWVEGRNIRYVVRMVGADHAGVDAAAVALARAGVDVLVGSGVPIIHALARATSRVPIVCGGISDPVGEGVARSLREPGMNVTGLSFGLPEAAALQIGTLKALVPGLARVVFVTAEVEEMTRPAAAHVAAASAVGASAELAKVANFEQVEKALGSMRPGVDAAWIALLPEDAPAARVASTAADKGIATHVRDLLAVKSGFLFSYWIMHADTLGRLAAIVDRVLRGADPARTPFELPDKTEFVLNRATAAALGLRVPPEILLRATEVIG